MAVDEVEAIQPGQLSLFKGQRVRVIDSKKDDWWLVRTEATESHSPLEGWVERTILQPVEGEW